ncbi:hypothetical protein, conserved [Eimeria acervulina]|uniref:Bromo domain-containing protein n=1 Tax=Eimeria acervulina TaxID=5801 RepID=U6GTZ8_EIMAC|nr:hypothetical protein, conserved [Eimeria acervulina]CDI83007.1 hypothetical protein, conserved [Eimeria acervulina]
MTVTTGPPTGAAASCNETAITSEATQLQQQVTAHSAQQINPQAVQVLQQADPGGAPAAVAANTGAAAAAAAAEGAHTGATPRPEAATAATAAPVAPTAAALPATAVAVAPTAAPAAEAAAVPATAAAVPGAEGVPATAAATPAAATAAAATPATTASSLPAGAEVPSAGPTGESPSAPPAASTGVTTPAAAAAASPTAPAASIAGAAVPSGAEAAAPTAVAAAGPGAPATPSLAGAASTLNSPAAGGSGGAESVASVSAPVLNGTVHGCHCACGELYLTEAEHAAIEAFFASVGGSSSGPWRLLEVPEGPSTGSRKSKKGSAAKRVAGAPPSALGGPQERQRRQSVASYGGPPAAAAVVAELPKTRSSRLRSGGLGAPLGGPPLGGAPPAAADAEDWPQRMQRILLELCRQPVCLPFLPRVSPSDAHYNELARKVFPAVPLSLETVLDRLEQGGYYSRSLEVFNDIYSVFLCAFRYYEPGHQYWMMAHEAALAFSALTVGEPLCNVFGPPPNSSSSSSSSSSSFHGNAASHADDHWELSSSRSTNHRNAARNAAKTKTPKNYDTQRTRSRGGAKGFAPSEGGGDIPVSVEERQTFQELLSQLSMDAHFQLYNTFKDRATWVSFDTGEVELDDGATMPHVFREMVQWCKAQVLQMQSQAGMNTHAALAAAAPQLQQVPAADPSKELQPPAKRMRASEDSASSDSSADLSDDDF